MTNIPYGDLETLFLDAGNTLVSIDFEWVARELDARGVATSGTALLRGEARARPLVSLEVGRLERSEGLDVFAFHLTTLLEQTDGIELESERREALVRELVPVLRAPGRTQRLWSSVLPGVPEALASLVELGLCLVVVSNSDGSCEETLVDGGLREYFHSVIDSHHVGFEKPDARIYEAAIERSGASRDRTLHVGDLYHADVEGARSAGIHPLLLDPFDDWPDVDCARLPDVPALARAIAAARRSA